MQKNKHTKLHIKKNDTIVLLKDITAIEKADGRDLSRKKGYKSRVLRVLRKKQQVIVEGVNIRFRHKKPTQQDQQGGREEREMPIHISNVALLDSDGNPTRIGYRYQETKKGHFQWVRYAKNDDQEIK